MNHRVFLTEQPYSEYDRDKAPFAQDNWPCSWIRVPKIGKTPHVTAYRLNVTAKKNETVRIHVSADERYILFLDGQRIGRGPERGSPQEWFFESYDLELSKGDHTLSARTWYLGEKLRPLAQMSVEPGFLLAAEGEWTERIGTGNAAWEGKVLGGTTFLPPALEWGCGAKVEIRADQYDWDHESGAGEGWQAVETIRPGFNPAIKRVDVPASHLLYPATIPPMMETERRIGNVRFVEEPTEAVIAAQPIHEKNNRSDEAAVWQTLLLEKQPVTVPAATYRRILIDLEDYYCAYPSLQVSGGRGTSIEIQWAESPYKDLTADWDAPADFIYGREKGNRDVLEGKYLFGDPDRFLLDGSASRIFETLWWRSGRYVQLVIQSADEPLTVEGLTLRETRYPFEPESNFQCDDRALQDVLPLMQRALLTGAHETYFDCPYYEQMMYIGDTRLEALTTHQITHDRRLAEKAIRLFNVSRWPNGITQARYPTDKWVDIPPFALYWTNMVYDHALWKNAPHLSEQWLLGVRAALDFWWKHQNSEGLIESPDGWNFVDWITDWTKGGIPSGGLAGDVSSILNGHLIYSLMLAAELEDHAGEPEAAQLQRRRARELTEALIQHFWDEKRGLFADDLSHEHWSEHAQLFLILSGLLDEARCDRIMETLASSEEDIARSTIYFSHYYLEACYQTRRMDLAFDRLKIWKELPGIGMKTTYEKPGNTRSDNHGWGSHPLYHCFASILGIRPGKMGYRTVHICPQLGPLNEASGKAIHPDGFIEASFRRNGEKLTGEISLPDGIDGTLEINGETIHIEPGVKNFKV